MKTKSREFTLNEIATKVAKYCISTAEYWSIQNSQNWKEKVEGLAHSIGAMIEGRTTSLPGLIICVEPIHNSLQHNFAERGIYNWPKTSNTIPFSKINDFNLPIKICYRALTLKNNQANDAEICKAVANEFLSIFENDFIAAGTLPHPNDQKFSISQGENYFPNCNTKEWLELDPNNSSLLFFGAKSFFDAISNNWENAQNILNASIEKEQLSSIIKTKSSKKNIKL